MLWWTLNIAGNIRKPQPHFAYLKVLKSFYSMLNRFRYILLLRMMFCVSPAFRGIVRSVLILRHSVIA